MTAAEDIAAVLDEWAWSLRGPWAAEMRAASGGDLAPLITSLRSDKPVDDEVRSFVAARLEQGISRRRGRPSQMMIVPHPLKPGEWLEIGRYDKHWPAASRMWTLMREGMSQKKALETAATEFKVDENSLVNWLRRTRKRGRSGSDS